MIKIGITGQSGFIGTHLYNTLSLFLDKYTLIPFEDNYFNQNKLLESFVQECDIIIHLAAMNRNSDPELIYKTNIELVKKLILALEKTSSKPYIIMSSSLQEFLDNPYGKSKREGRELFNQWADKNNTMFTGLIIPNVFGPFGVPFYNSVISTFSYQLVNNLEPKIEIDNKLNLIYVGDLINFIIGLIDKYGHIIQRINIHKSLGTNNEYPPRKLQVESQTSYKVSEILEKLQYFKEIYYRKNIFPDLSDYFDLCLFNTFRSYIYLDYFPHLYKLNPDDRGVYVEWAKSLSRGQSSYSTTKPQITRGNHFHLRKVERFAVIKGIASIKLRKYGTNEIKEFILDGNNPAFVDIPIWFVHNITNIGDSNLITLFWTNEFFDPSDADTYFERI